MELKNGINKFAIIKKVLKVSSWKLLLQINEVVTIHNDHI